MKLVLEVKGCSDCPCNVGVYGRESYNYCRHPQAPKGYENTINNPDQTPTWCPIREVDNDD